MQPQEQVAAGPGQHGALVHLVPVGPWQRRPRDLASGLAPMQRVAAIEIVDDRTRSDDAIVRGIGAVSFEHRELVERRVADLEPGPGRDACLDEDPPPHLSRYEAVEDVALDDPVLRIAQPVRARGPESVGGPKPDAPFGRARDAPT